MYNALVVNSNGGFMKKFGFTLAEVLIVIAIIGVVSVLVLPTLHENYQKKLYATSLKKNYTMLIEAFRKAMNDDNTEDFYATELGDAILSSSNSDFDKILNKYLNNYKGLYAYHMYYGNFNGTNKYSTYLYTGNYRQVNLPNATIYFPRISVLNSSTNYNNGYYSGYQITSANFYIDVNGANKGPNRVGIDLFGFQMYQDLSLYKFNANHVCTTNSADPMVCFQRIMNDNWEIKYY